MNTSLREKLNQQYRMSDRTSAGAAIKPHNTHTWSSYGIFAACSGTTTARFPSSQELLGHVERITTAIPLFLPSKAELELEEPHSKESQEQIASKSRTSETTRKSLNELRRLSGLTWDQLAKIFKVTRRSLHFWASGQSLTPSNEEQLNRVLSAIQYIDRGSADFNRSLLLETDNNGNLLLDLLISEKYEEFKQIAGAGKVRHQPQLGSLSEDAKAARTPQKPEDLVNALQDSVHYEIGQSRPVKAARSQKNSSE